jgi:hypothetical protein
VRIDFATKRHAKTRKQLADLSKTYRAEHHQVEIAIWFLGPFCRGAKHESHLDTGML